VNPTTNPAKLPDPDSAWLSSGTPIAFIDAGNGSPLLLVHGSLCDYRYWQPQFAAFAAQHRTIAVSLSHYYPLQYAASGQQFSWWAHVEELAQFIDHLDCGPVHLLGHSRGGCIAFQLAVRDPHLVKSLTLADPGGPLQTGPIPPQEALPPAVMALRERAANLISAGMVDEGLELFVDSVSMPGFWNKSSTAFKTMARDNANTLVLQFGDPLPAYNQADAEAVACPVLLIDGEKSPKMYQRNVEALADWLAVSERATIRAASHGMNVANPGAFNRHVLEFTARQDS
jgi:pimeloyl-ACP methyl ester carboxylesterase